MTGQGEVVLLEEERDRVSFDEECPRGPGFWCQNQDGKNPNLSAEEFKAFAEEAAGLLSKVPALDTPQEVAAAVCNTGDQLLRHLATLALNLASDTLTRDTALVDEPFCHIPPGNPANRHTITIGASAWPAHRAHGDTIGPCQ